MFASHVLEAVLNGDFKSPLVDAAGGPLSGAQNEFQKVINGLNPAKEAMSDLKNWAKDLFDDWMPAADEWQQIEEDIKQVKDSIAKVLSACADKKLLANWSSGLGGLHKLFRKISVRPKDVRSVLSDTHCSRGTKVRRGCRPDSAVILGSPKHTSIGPFGELCRRPSGNSFRSDAIKCSQTNSKRVAANRDYGEQDAVLRTCSRH
jgi:hypothetical protein